MAAQIRVTTFTIRNWEHNKAEPEVQHLPAIIRFLGTIPFNVGDSFGEMMKTYRYIRGLSIDNLASNLGIDPGTLSRIESGIPPMPCMKRRITKHFHMIISEADRLQSGSVLKERITEATENIK
ncbi:MAG: helix-turn-helix transcriptional regulator [Bacteroidetes bacterium]|nr:helix-turn-helix transcriptional regulator [Bacteroidota bacterium]